MIPAETPMVVDVRNRLKIVLVLAIAIYLVIGTYAGVSKPNGRAGKSHIAHVYLYEKDPVNWTVVDNGSWGKMKYEVSGSEFDFVFNGHNLVAYQNYTLIYYPDPWPGDGLICLGAAMANNESNVHIKETVDTGDLPAVFDENYPNGSKIWLVLSVDVDCNNSRMVGWHPSEYLFEGDLIVFDDEDDVASVDEDVDGDETSDEMTADVAGEDISIEMSVSIIDDDQPENKDAPEKKTQAMQRVFTLMLEKEKELPPGLMKIWSHLGLIR